jgi:hypothetical protein
MTREVLYTDEFYEDAIQAAWNKMGAKRYYTKTQILLKAGFDEDQRHHWPKLRRAAGRLGLPICYCGLGWYKATGALVLHEWDKRMERHAKSMRQNIIGHLQKSDGAQQAVAYLLEEEMDPFAAPVILRAYGAGLPRDVVAELAAATRLMLPEMNRETREKITATSEEIAAIAGLLMAPASKDVEDEK